MFRKRQYRKKVKCTACKKELCSDYTADHLKQLHGNDKSVKFVIAKDDPKQKKITFASFSSKVSLPLQSFLSYQLKMKLTMLHEILLLVLGC